MGGVHQSIRHDKTLLSIVELAIFVLMSNIILVYQLVSIDIINYIIGSHKMKCTDRITIYDKLYVIREIFIYPQPHHVVIVIAVTHIGMSHFMASCDTSHLEHDLVVISTQTIFRIPQALPSEL